MGWFNHQPPTTNRHRHPGRHGQTPRVGSTIGHGARGSWPSGVLEGGGFGGWGNLWQKIMEAKYPNWVMVSQIFYVHPQTLGDMIQFDVHIFQMGCLNHQLVEMCFYLNFLCKIPEIPPWKRKNSPNCQEENHVPNFHVFRFQHVNCPECFFKFCQKNKPEVVCIFVQWQFLIFSDAEEILPAT